MQKPYRYDATPHYSESELKLCTDSPRAHAYGIKASRTPNRGVSFVIDIIYKERGRPPTRRANSHAGACNQHRVAHLYHCGSIDDASSLLLRGVIGRG